MSQRGTKREGRILPWEPTVPARPFADWLEARVHEYEQELGGSEYTSGAVQRLAGDLGWGADQNGVRRLYRYRNAVTETAIGPKGNRKRITKTAEVYARRVVENACHRIDPDLFYDIYPEYRHERDVVLEPDAWCPFCEELVTPVDGLCPWCVCEHGHLFREVGVTDDGFACLACAKEERKARAREHANRRNAEKRAGREAA